MTAISQALEDIKKYLEIDRVRNIKVSYDVNEDNYKEVRLTFNSNEAGYQIVAIKVGVRK